jgi:DNA invertase Pin-like site-specific DNA recombinase
MNNRRYIIYVRKSSDRDDRQVLSVNSQLDECKRLAARDNLKIVKIFQEEKSAKTPGRRLFNELVEMLETDKADGVICWAVNRLSRNAKDGGIIQWVMDDKDVEIRTPYQIYNKHNSSLQFKIETGQAEQYSKDLSLAVKRGNRTHFKQGTYLGMAPPGYLNREEEFTERSYIIKDPERFHLIRKAWDLLLSENYNIPQIIKILNEDYGYSSRKTLKMTPKPMPIMTLRRIFHNPFYYGWMSRMVDGELMEGWGNHEPMISKEEFEKAQAIMGERPITRQPDDISMGLNGSLIKCGECECSITFEVNNKNYKNGSIGTFVYARCSKKKGPCSQKYVPIKKLNDQVEEVLSKLEISSEFIDWTLECIRDENMSEELEIEALRANIEAKLADTRKRRDRLLEVYLNDPEIMGKDEYLSRNINLGAEEEKWKEQLEGVDFRRNNWLELAAQTLHFAQDSLKDWQTGDATTKKRIIKTIGGSNLKIKDGNLEFIPEKPYFILYENADLCRKITSGGPGVTLNEPLAVFLNEFVKCIKLEFV